MKKLIAFVLSLSALTVNVWASDISVELNGEDVAFLSQEPVIVDGRTLIPLRGVFEQLGYEISWEGDTKTATFSDGENTILITAGSNAFIMNGEAIALDVPASIINGSMLLPLRAVGEAAGLSVEWDGSTKTVVLSSSEKDNKAEEAELTYEEEMAAISDAVDAISAGYTANVLMGMYFSVENNRLEQISDLLSRTINSKEVYGLIEEGSEYCGIYREAVGSLSELKGDEDIYNGVIDVFNAMESYYDFLTEYIINDSYRSTTTAKIMSRQEGLINDINKKCDSLDEKISGEVYDLNHKYYYPAAAEMGEDEEGDYEAYSAWLYDMGTTITEEMATIDVDAPESSAIKAAAEGIMSKLNSADTPDCALFNKALINKACLKLREAADFSGDFEGEDIVNPESVKYLCNILDAELLFQTAAGSYYETENNDGYSDDISIL